MSVIFPKCKGAMEGSVVLSESGGTLPAIVPVDE